MSPTATILATSPDQQGPCGDVGSGRPRRRPLDLVMIHAFVLMNVEPQHIAEVAERTAEFTGVQSAHSVAGGSADVVAVLAVPDHQGVATVVTEHLSTLPGIRSTQTLIGFRTYSSQELDAAWDGIGD